ncbi:hypothetical protein M404DRAFT_28897 [Pisolithus tinctorius Marx 270]|uniref:Uncharacterized protein n=1 Tax=Pisolithus tinctorius Marx 270 TaxID=870435 RepID=A0A0C3NJJ8_PISTI|nr:hypothetical protein M404DRAFT_28897 [Pisolithus tinctorius Marx 270]
MSLQRENTTPQPTPGHSHDYSQVMDDALVILTNDSTNTERENNVEKTCWREEAEEAQLEVEWRQREEEEAQRKKVAEEEAERQRQKVAVEEAERQRQRASQEWAQARQDEATQK